MRMSAPTVLVVDANPSTALRVAEALRHTSFAVAAATTQAEADAVIEQADVAALIAALSFPKGNGYDLASSVKARQPAAATFLVTGGFEVYQAQRAEAAGVDGRMARPLQPESVRAQLESVLGPITAEPSVEPAPEPVAAAAPPPPPVAAPAPRTATPVGDERVASFVPRDWQELPLVRVDPSVVGPAVERAILELLPEVVETVLRKSLLTSAHLQELIETAVDDAVRQQLPELARRVIEERLAEMDASRSSGS